MAGLGQGEDAPRFALVDQHGATIDLADYRGRKVLVYFYPAADTPGCTAQSCDLRDHRQELASIGVDVIGISPDPPIDQLAFDTKYGLRFPLLSDQDHHVAGAWGTWVERERDGHRSMAILRSSFLVDEEGRVERAWYGIKPEETVPEALRAVRR